MTALSVAGFDPSGGAGLIADLETFFSLGLQGRGVVTAVTAQSSAGVRGVIDIPAAGIRDQLLSVKEEGMPPSLKSGMLATAEAVDVLADFLQETAYRVFVIDPVLVSTSGYPLLKEPGLRVLKERLLPLATVVTPNIEEAEKLSGITIDSSGALREAASRIHDLGAGGVVITGGDRSTDQDETVVDLLFDGVDYLEVASERVGQVNLHGTGCIYSAALTAYLHDGETLGRSAWKAKHFLVNRLKRRHPIDFEPPLC